MFMLVLIDLELRIDPEVVIDVEMEIRFKLRIEAG